MPRAYSLIDGLVCAPWLDSFVPRTTPFKHITMFGIWTHTFAFFFQVPSLFKIRPPNSEKPDDVECCRGSVNGKPPGTADDTHATSITKSPGAMSIEIDAPVPYEPPLGEILSEGSTSCIVNVAIGVVIKCPRSSWWHSETAADKWFVRDVKRSFEVEEQLLQILGLHPRIIKTSEIDRN
ncbi:hypothetical protein NUU61_006194 [Penicillium alfredii]|uniref:Uncharacterized protein n=1 Tax=Penicillium alfredii TaxID=1506179 RepID=A0A9W9F0E2_9EURO|nr:uncharacterized protein NUU61_006194 [Penicillium alfredii]KAJ5091324.1 hypothetical protein NUU61_006194 [Penicillium alfredii]